MRKLKHLFLAFLMALPAATYTVDAFGMNLAPLIRQRYFDASGNPLAGGKLYSYQAGTSTPQATYTDAAGGTPNANPVVLDANGEANVWLDPDLSYKFVLKSSSDVTQWTVDNVVGLLEADSVPTASLQDSAVTTAKIADDAVTNAKLKDSASTDADRAVTTNHIRDEAITGPKLGDTAITDPTNYAITAAHNTPTNALTIALKAASGSDATSANPIKLNFRHATLTTGTPVVVDVTGALDVVVNASSTLGHASATAETLCLYAINNAGTAELAVSSYCGFDNGGVVTTVDLDAGNADLRYTLYSETARSNVAVKLLGRLTSTQSTAGTWATSISEIALAPFKYTEWFAQTQLTAPDSDCGLSTDGSPVPLVGSSGALSTHTRSVPIWITCATGTDSSGANCGGTNESSGIAVFPPSGFKGDVEACLEFQSGIRDETSAATSTYKLAMTEDSTYTITQDAATHTNGTQYGSGGGTTDKRALTFCQNFHFSGAASKYTMRFFKQVTVAIASTHTCTDFHFRVKPLQ